MAELRRAVDDDIREKIRRAHQNAEWHAIGEYLASGWEDDRLSSYLGPKQQYQLHKQQSESMAKQLEFEELAQRSWSVMTYAKASRTADTDSEFTTTSEVRKVQEDRIDV